MHPISSWKACCCVVHVKWCCKAHGPKRFFLKFWSFQEGNEMPGIDRFHPLHAFAICNEKFSFSVVWVFISCIYISSPELCYRLELWGRFYFMSVVFLFAKKNKIAQNKLQKIKKDTSQAHIYICACNIHIRVHHKFKVI